MKTYRDHIKLRIRKLDRAIEALEDLPTSLGIITNFVEKLKRQRARHLKLMKEIERRSQYD
jgi:hypothetical protein